MSSPSGFSRRGRGSASLAWRSALIAAPLILLALSFGRFLDAMLTPPILRSPAHLKDGSVVGLRYAYIGGLMLAAAQGHILAKAVASAGLRVRLPPWLSLHCVLSTWGGVLLMLHAGFPYSFGYFDPISRMNPALGLPALIAVRGLLTWLLAGVGVSGFALRYLRIKAGGRRALKLLHTLLAASAYALGLIHIYLSTFLPAAR